MYGFRWIGKLWKLAVTHSKYYCGLAEKLADARRENVSLQEEYGAEITELQMTLDKSDDSLRYANLQVTRLKRTKIELERDKASLEKNNLELISGMESLRAYAIRGLEGVLETFGHAPGFLVTSDFVPVRANTLACKYFEEQVVGKTFHDLGIYEQESQALQEEVLTNGRPFIIGYKDSKLAGWGVVPLMDINKKILACLFTSEKELIKRITAEKQGFFRSALEAFIGRKQLEAQGMAIGEDFTLVKARG